MILLSIFSCMEGQGKLKIIASLPIYSATKSVESASPNSTEPTVPNPPTLVSPSAPVSSTVLGCSNHANNNVVVSTFAGSTVAGSTDALGTAASFNHPNGIAIASDGIIFIADSFNNKIRLIDPSGLVSTFAGLATNLPGSADNTGMAASFFSPIGIAVDSSGTIFVSDSDNNKIRKIARPGVVVTTLAGLTTNLWGSTDNAIGNLASFRLPTGLAVDSSENIYVSDNANSRIRKITPVGSVTTLAGQLANTSGSTNANGTAASFNGVQGLAIDVSGNIYVSDSGNNKIRKITPTGDVSTFVGLPSNAAGSFDAQGTMASLNSPWGITIDSYGTFFVADSGNNKVRKISSVGEVTTLAGTGAVGFANGNGTVATFNGSNGASIAIDSNGIVYLVEDNNHMIRKIVCN